MTVGVLLPVEWALGTLASVVILLCVAWTCPLATMHMTLLGSRGILPSNWHGELKLSGRGLLVVEGWCQGLSSLHTCPPACATFIMDAQGIPGIVPAWIHQKGCPRRETTGAREKPVTVHMNMGCRRPQSVYRALRVVLRACPRH